MECASLFMQSFVEWRDDLLGSNPAAALCGGLLRGVGQGVL
jgi:hypothetical protein